MSETLTKRRMLGLGVMVLVGALLALVLMQIAPGPTRGFADPVPDDKQTGAELLHQLGLDGRLASEIPEGCHNSYWVSDGLGACIDGMAADGVEMRILVQRLRGIYPSDLQIEAETLREQIGTMEPGHERTDVIEQLRLIEESLGNSN